MSTKSTERPLRADAQRNRARILAAARKLLAARGNRVPIEEIAHRAKVGIGTFYRHFPTREALIAEIIREHFTGLAEVSRPALDHEDAWEGFSAAIWDQARFNVGNLGACEAMLKLGTDGDIDIDRVAIESGLAGVTGALIERAQAQGTMRADVTVADIALLMTGGAAIMQLQTSISGRRSPDAWERYVELTLDALRNDVPS